MRITITLVTALFLLLPAHSLRAQNLKGDIDGSLRWLRYRQQPNGSWGGTAADTAAVLYAFAVSPRAYRVEDGPWLARGVEFLLGTRDPASGSFGVEGEDPLRATLLTAVALRAIGAKVGSAVITRAIDWAAASSGRPAPARNSPAGLARWVRACLRANIPPAPPEPSAAADLAKQILSERTRQGYFGKRDLRLSAERVALLGLCAAVLAREKGERPKAPPGPLPAPRKDFDLDRLRTAGTRFLLDPKLRIKGMWGFASYPDVGITAIVLAALQATPERLRTTELQREIDRGLELLLSSQHEDGSIHGGQVIAYTTSIAILALARSKRPEHRRAVERARNFLVNLQADEGEGYSEEHKYYGGIGYGNDERPDLSNLQLAMDALSAAGLDAGSATFRKALKFLERCQNRSESNRVTVHNAQGTFVAGNDGGAAYAPGESPAGFIELADGRKIVRSYGSMTYALLKGFLFAGLPRDDPRVRAAYQWIQRNYTVDLNPGFGHLPDPRAGLQGYFYYLYTMARTLDLYGSARILDRDGKSHLWRREIAGQLAALQRPDGSWVNQQAQRWWEGNPVLATAYALLTLEFCQPREGVKKR